MTFEDPQIRKRVLQLLVAFSTTALDNNPNLMLRVLEHILMTWPALQPENRAYNDAIKDLQAESMVELQRLAAKMPDHLLVSESLVPPNSVTNRFEECLQRYRDQGQGDDGVGHVRRQALCGVSELPVHHCVSPVVQDSAEYAWLIRPQTSGYESGPSDQDPAAAAVCGSHQRSVAEQRLEGVDLVVFGILSAFGA